MKKTVGVRSEFTKHILVSTFANPVIFVTYSLFINLLQYQSNIFLIITTCYGINLLFPELII